MDRTDSVSLQKNNVQHENVITWLKIFVSCNSKVAAHWFSPWMKMKRIIQPLIDCEAALKCGSPWESGIRAESEGQLGESLTHLNQSRPSAGEMPDQTHRLPPWMLTAVMLIMSDPQRAGGTEANAASEPAFPLYQDIWIPVKKISCGRS